MRGRPKKHVVLPRWSSKETAWLAGLLEGEGCFNTHRGTKGFPCWNTLYTRLSIYMADRDVIERVARLVGGNMTTKAHRPPYKIQYGFTASGQRAEIVMTRILPFMGKRRSKRITEALDIAKKQHIQKERK